MLDDFDTCGVSNGPTQALNLLIRKIKEAATASATSTTTGYAPALLTAYRERPTPAPPGREIDALTAESARYLP